VTDFYAHLGFVHLTFLIKKVNYKVLCNNGNTSFRSKIYQVLVCVDFVKNIYNFSKLLCFQPGKAFIAFIVLYVYFEFDGAYNEKTNSS